MKKKLLTILLSVFMVMSTFTTSVFAEAQKIGDSNTTWELTNINTVLTIGGTGNMPDLSITDYPWYLQRNAITSIIVGSGVTSIGSFAFSNQNNVTSITLPSSLKSIGESSFSSCKATSIAIPESVNSIGANAFEFCSGLTNITIPSNVKSIGSFAFNGCTSLSMVVCNADTPPTAGTNIFAGCNALAAIYVPESSVDAYKTNWSTYTDKIQAIPKTIADILPNGFPTDYTTGWVNVNYYSARVFKNDGCLCFKYNDEVIYSINLNETLTFENDKYKYTSTFMDGSRECELVCIFAMNGETLSYINLDLGTNLYQEVQSDYVESVTVTFNMNGHGTQVPDQVIPIEGTATEPTNPTADGHIFNGWYMSANCEGSPFNFDTSITKELIGDGLTITLYAKWKEPTIADILGTVEGEFPTTYTNGWLNENGKDIHVTLNNLYLRKESIAIPDSSSLTLKNGNYEYYGDNNLVVTFVMTSNKLTKIICSNTGNSDYDGEYLPQTSETIADVLAKAEKAFPTSHTVGWINESGYYVTYVYNNILCFQAKNYYTPYFGDFSITAKLRKEGDNYIANNGNVKVTFEMESGVLTSITLTNCSSAELNSKYTAPPVTIASLLDTVENFPNSKSFGWIKKENNTDDYKAYINGTNLQIALSKIPLNAVVTKEGANYKYKNGRIIAQFKIESNVLKGITLSAGSLDADGDYVPYKYEIEQTESKPQGYTGNLVFKTNGKYTDPSHVVVKVDGTPLTLNTDYEVDQGSIIVTLLGDYIKNLAPKTYTISIGVKDGDTELYGEITSQFTITAAPTPTPTPKPDSKSAYKFTKTGVE